MEIKTDATILVYDLAILSKIKYEKYEHTLNHRKHTPEKFPHIHKGECIRMFIIALFVEVGN